MSSLKQLNKSIKLKKLQSKDSARQCEQSLNLLLFTVSKHTKKHPFVVTAGVSLATIVLTKYRNKIKSFYPVASLGMNYYMQHRQSKGE